MLSLAADKGHELSPPSNTTQVHNCPCQYGPQGPPRMPGRDGRYGLSGASRAPRAEGTPGIDGKEGVMGPLGMDGRNVFPSPHETSGRNGRDNAVGPPDRHGKDGLPGLSEASVAPRTPGIDGRDTMGTMGPPGRNGRDGASGRDGRDGAVGPPGPSAGLDLAEIRDFVKLVVQEEIQNWTHPPVTMCPGWSADRPANSCRSILDCNPLIPSGYYWISNGTQPHLMYCYMEADKCGVRGVMRVAHIVRKASVNCPAPLKQYQLDSEERMCRSITVHV